jgi:predicted nucleic acid-binding protein
MPFVVDASVVAVWAIEDESSELAEMLLARAEVEGVLSPDFLWYEVRRQ